MSQATTEQHDHERTEIEIQTAEMVEQLATHPDVKAFYGLFIYKETESFSEQNPDGTPCIITPTLVAVKNKTGATSVNSMTAFSEAIISNLLNHDPMMVVQLIADCGTALVKSLKTHVVGLNEEDNVRLDEGLAKFKESLMDLVFDKFDFGEFLLQFNHYTSLLREKNPDLPESFSEHFANATGLNELHSENKAAVEFQRILTNTLSTCRPEHRQAVLEYITKIGMADLDEFDFDVFEKDLNTYISTLPINSETTSDDEK